MKQTAVEWLFEQYVNKSIITIEDIEQAKEMEKEQNKQSYFKGWHRDIGNRDEDFEQYYNENFKSE